ELLTRAASSLLRDRPRAACALPALFTSRIASRNERPVSALLLSPRVLTVSVAGAIRSSRISTVGRLRAGALRMVRGLRDANGLRIQERVVMANLLPGKVGP